jgi:hypothetical protein
MAPMVSVSDNKYYVKSDETLMLRPLPAFGRLLPTKRRLLRHG